MAYLTQPPSRCIPADPTRYDSGTELTLGEHAIASYLDDEAYCQEAERAGYKHGEVHHVGPAQVALAHGEVRHVGPAQVALAWTEDVIVVSIRGSDQRLDWIGNLTSFLRTPWRPYLPREAKLGRGFKRQVSGLAPVILARLRSLLAIYPNADIVLTGHSLGATQVPPLVAYLNYHNIDVQVGYCFEPPRPGNEAFANWYDAHFQHTYTVINVVRGERDLVTRVPLSRYGASHVGSYVIHSNGHTFLGQEHWREYREANKVSRIAAWRFVSRLVFSTRAHTGRSLLRVLRDNHHQKLIGSGPGTATTNEA